MRNEQGFSLIELLIVVAIIAIIAAIAVPSLMTARMAANEASAIQGCRTVGSAEIAFASTANQTYTDIAGLIAASMLDQRFAAGNSIDGYGYAPGQVTVLGGAVANFPAAAAGGVDFGILATPVGTMGRWLYGIGTDQVVRYMGKAATYNGAETMTAGQGIGTSTGGGS